MMWRMKVRRRDDNEDPQVADGPPAIVYSPPHTNMEQKSQTDLEHQICRWPSRTAQEPPMMVNPQPQANAEYQEHPETTAGHPHVPDECPATVGIEDVETDDIVIAVMGPTGSGKSSFIRVASGHDTQGVGHTLKSHTSEVTAIRFWDSDSGRHIVLVDTPGFDDTYKSDLDVLNMISEWLNSSYEKQKLLSGILYLHQITDNRMAGTPLKNLRVFRKLCGRDALDKVYLVTTMWDEVDAGVGEKRLAELQHEYWKTMITQGAQIARCRNDDDSGKKIVQQIILQEATRKAVLLQKEMGDLGVVLKETEAGKELHSHLEKLVEKQLALLMRINQERKNTSDASVLAELQAEYNELREQIDNNMRQAQELKLSRLKSLRRFFIRRRD